MSDIRPNQRIALEALAAGKKIEEAAGLANVTERTIYKWRTQTAFKTEMQQMTDGAVGQASVVLSRSALSAVQTLVTISEDPEAKKSVRVAAASKILDNLFRVKELYDFASRLEAIEQQNQEIQRALEGNYVAQVK